MPRALPDVGGWGRALCGAGAQAEGRGFLVTQSLRLPPRALHLPVCCAEHQGGERSHARAMSTAEGAAQAAAPE